MKASIECPLCEKRYTVSETMLGKKVKCRDCGSSFSATFAVDPPSTTQPIPAVEEGESFSFAAANSKPSFTTSSKNVSGFIDAFFALFDWRFKRYLTPWVVRVTWIVFLALVAMWLLTICLGVVISLFPFDSPAPANRRFPQFDKPESSGLPLYARYIAGLITMVTTSILGVLWVRVILELVVVRFNMAESLRSLENDLKVARKN